MELKYNILTLGLVAALAGCGGGAGGDDSEDRGGDGDGGGPATVERISFSGLVADGYLDGAKVCLDINENKICDDGEPSTTSGTGGVFEITDATQEQRDTYPLLVEVVVGTTIDEDNEGVALTKPLTLTAPVGYSFVSPLSTMVQNEVEDGATSSAAEQAVQEKLGTTLSLDEDYIAAQESGDFTEEEQAEFEQLHQVAQVTARVISENIVKLEDAAQENNISLDDLISAIVDEVFDALDEITQQVEEVVADPETEFDPDTVAQSVDEEVVNLEPDTIDDVVDQNQAEEAAASVDMSVLLTSPGLTWFEAKTDDGPLEALYASIYNDDTGSFKEDEFTWDGSAFIAAGEGGSSDPAYILTDGGWQLVANYWDPDSITGFSDGRIEIVRAGGAVVERLISEEVDLNELSTRGVMNDVDDGDSIWGNYLAADSTFPLGSKGYTLADNGSDQVPVIEDWGDCEAGAFNGFCNSVNLRTNNVDSAATNMSQVLVATAGDLTGLTTFEEKMNELVTIDLGNNGNLQLQAEMLQNGIVNFYQVDHFAATITLLNSATWTSVTKGESEIYELDVTGLEAYDPESILSEIEGYVRRTEKPGQGNDTAELRLLNPTAVAAVTGLNFSLDNIPLAATAPCADGNSVWDGNTDGGTIVAQWGLASDFETAVSSCLATAGNTEIAYIESELKDVVSDSLVNDRRTTFLANGMGVFTGSTGQLWFDWNVEPNGRLMFSYVNPVNGPETIITAQTINNLEQAYVQSKSFLENVNITALLAASGSPSRGLIGVDAFEVSPLDPVATVLPTITFNLASVAGIYTARPAIGDGGGDFIFNTNGTGSVHWLPDAEQIAQDQNHPGDNDTLNWIVDAQGRLVVTLIDSEGNLSGVDRYALTSGEQTSGEIKAEGINANGRYQALGDFTWTKTDEAPVALCTTGNAAGTVNGGDMPTSADLDVAVGACLGVNPLVRFTVADFVDTTLTQRNVNTGASIDSYTFSGWDSVKEQLRGSFHSVADNADYSFSWGMAEDGQGDTTGLMLVAYDGVDGGADELAMLAFDDSNLRIEMKVRTYEPGDAGNDEAEIFSSQYVKEYTQPRSSLADLAGIWDDNGEDGADLFYLHFSGSNMTMYDDQDDALASPQQACYKVFPLAITDQGDGQFRITGTSDEDVNEDGILDQIDITVPFYNDGTYLYGDEGEKAAASITATDVNECPAP